MTTERSDAELIADIQLLRDFADLLETQHHRSMPIRLRKIADGFEHRLTQPSVDPISDIESPRLITQEEAEELESLPVRPYPPRRLPAAPSVEEVIEAARKLARGHEPVHGWGTRTEVNDIWADGFRTACVEISDALAQLLSQLRNEDG